MCACDHELLTGYWYNLSQEQCMMPLQLSEKGFHCWEVWCIRAVTRETTFTPCLSHVGNCHMGLQLYPSLNQNIILYLPIMPLH